MMTQTTCATCPFARHIEGNKYECTAEHNHHNSVTRGHWEATQDCYEAIASEQELADDDYVPDGQKEAIALAADERATNQPRVFIAPAAGRKVNPLYFLGYIPGGEGGGVNYSAFPDFGRLEGYSPQLLVMEPAALEQLVALR